MERNRLPFLDKSNKLKAAVPPRQPAVFKDNFKTFTPVCVQVQGVLNRPAYTVSAKPSGNFTAAPQLSVVYYLLPLHTLFFSQNCQVL